MIGIRPLGPRRTEEQADQLPTYVGDHVLTMENGARDPILSEVINGHLLSDRLLTINRSLSRLLRGHPYGRPGACMSDTSP